MPTKKGGSQVASTGDKESKCQASGGIGVSDMKDPFEWIVNLVEKKKRNLDKRKVRLETLNDQLEEGKELDKDQREAITKLPEVSIQIAALKDLLINFQQVHDEYQKEIKKRQKSEEKRQKEAEKEFQQNLVGYCLKVERLLTLVDDTAKEAFRTGSNGAIVLSEAELSQIDSFYDLVNPLRPGNEKYRSELAQATDHFLFLYEKSTKAVANTTYAALHELLEKMDNCGYFDKEIEEDEEELELENDIVVIEEVTVLTPEPVIANYNVRVESPHQTTPPIPLSTVATFGEMQIPPSKPLAVETVPHHNQSNPSVPSPDFAGLQTSAFSPLDELTFMRDSPTHPLVENTETQFHATFSNNIGMSDEVPQQGEASGTHPPFTAFPSDHTPQDEPSMPISAIPSSNGVLTDGQYVPETGQQVVEEKEKNRSSNKPNDYRNKGFSQQRGSGFPSSNRWRNNNGRGNYGGGSNFSRGFNNMAGGSQVKQERGGGQQYQRGKGRTNYAYNGRPNNTGYKPRPSQ